MATRFLCTVEAGKCTKIDGWLSQVLIEFGDKSFQRPAFIGGSRSKKTWLKMRSFHHSKIWRPLEVYMIYIYTYIYIYIYVCLYIHICNGIVMASTTEWITISIIIRGMHDEWLDMMPWPNVGLSQPLPGTH